MATEEEAREAAADGEEVQVEAVDLGTAHLQMNLDGKLSAHGMKDEAKIMDSTEGMLKVTEDQVLEKAPSVVEIPPEHTPNGTASSLNGHMKEGEISNEKPQEIGQKANEQVEASPDGVRTDQSNKSNGQEAVDSLGHVESTTEDTSLLNDENEEPKEHYQQDVESAAVENKMVHEDTVETDEPTVDAQQGQNLEPAEVTEDTEHASTSCIPHDEVIAEAPAGVQTCLEPNVNDSGALPDASDGNTETEPAKVDKESCPEDEDIAEHTNEIIKLEYQLSKQTDDVDAELVKEDVPISKKTDLPEDVTKAEQADESAYEETTPEHDATAREPALDAQEVQSQGLAEEIADAKEVDSEKTVQRSGVSFEEATPEDNVATIEPSSDIQHLNNVESEEIKGLEDASQDKEGTEDIQPVQGFEEEEPSTGNVKVDEASNQPHADVLNNLVEEDGVPACQPQVTELEEEVKDAGVTETQEISQQSHAAASEELVTEENSMAVDLRNDDIQQTLEQGSVEVKETPASETQEICHERTISASEEDSAEDDVTAVGPISDAQEVENVESVEEIKDNTADNIVEVSNVPTVEEAYPEHNVITREDVSEQQAREVEPEEIQSTEHPALLKEPAQEDSIPSDMLKTESTAEINEMEATKTEVLPEECNISTSEEPASEENISASERTCDAQEVKNSEQAEDVEGNKDNGTKDITGQSNENNIANLEEMAIEDGTTILTDASIQQLQEKEPVEFKDTATEPQEISPSHIVSTSKESTPEDNVTAEPSPDSQAENLEAEAETVTKEIKDVKNTDAVAEEETPDEHVQEFEAPVHTPSVEDPELEETKNTDNQMDATVLENPTHEDTPTASESLVMESAEVSSSETTEGQEMPQSEVTESEDHETEENTTAGEPQVLEPEAAEEMRDSEATEPQSISQPSVVSSSDESVPEEDVTAKEPASDTKEVQTEEPELIDEQNDVKTGEMSNQSSGTIVGETAQENLESSTVTEESRDVISTDAIAEDTPEEHVHEFEVPVDIPPVDEPELEETKNIKPVEVHGNVGINDQPAEEVKNTEATEIAEIHNESGDLTEDVKRDVDLADKAAPDEHAKATEATADIPQAQDPELEETKNSELVEVENNIITSDLPEEEIKDTEATKTEEIPDESTSAKITELTNDALAEEAAPEELVIETEATIDIPQAQELGLEESKNAEPAEVEENISATDQSAEEIEATDATETEAINESINANTSKLTEDVTAKEPASGIKEVQTEEPKLIDEHNVVKAGEISNQSSRTIVGETAQANSESATVIEETKDVKSTDAIAEEETPAEHVQEFEAPVDILPVEEPELEEGKNTEHVSVHDDAMTNDLPAEEVKDTQATEIAEIQNESGHLTEDVKSNLLLSDEAAADEDAEATEATVDIPQAQDPEQEKIKNNEPVEVEDNIIARDLPEEEIKDTEAMEVIPDDSTSEKITELTNDVKCNVTLAEEAAPEEHVIEIEATIDIPRAQEPAQEETKNTEPLEVDENISGTDQSAEEIKATEAMETEAINESTDGNSSELTEDVKKKISLADEAAHEEHVIAAETTVNITRAREPELEEIKNTEPVEVKENISVSDLPAEEVKETEVISEGTDANISEPIEDVKRNVALADEAASEDHVVAPEATVDIPRAQEPVLEEIKNAEHVEVEENISQNDLPAEENFTENEPQVSGIEPTRPEPTPHESNGTIQQLQEQKPDKFRDTEATEPQGISPSHTAFSSEESAPEDNVATEPSPDTQAENLESAKVTEETKDVKSTDAIVKEETPEEDVQEFEAPLDIPPVEEPELEETKNTEPVEVHDNVATNDLPAEEVKNTEATEIAEIHNESGDLTEDVKSNVALADDAAPDEDAKATEEIVDIPRAQEPELEEIKNSEPVEVKENISASDLTAEELKETEVISESTDANITEDANRNVAVADEAAPEEHVIATEATVDIPRAQEPEIEEIENAEHVEVEENISANDLQEEDVKDTETMENQAIEDSTNANITELTEDVSLADEAVPDVHADIPPAQEPAVEKINNTKHVEAEDSITADNVPEEEKNDIEAMETEEIPHESTDDSLTASAPLADIQQAPEESSEQRSDPDLLVQSEDSKDQLVKAEETDQSNGATLEEPTAEDQLDSLADTKEEHGLESVEGNKGIEATEGEEASHPSQDAGLEELVAESFVATIEPTSDIQQVNGLDEAKEMTVTEPIDDEETFCKKTEVATLEDLSPTDNGTSPKQKDGSSELGEKTAFTTQKGESPNEEDIVQISGEDTVGISNNTEQIKEQSKNATEADTIKSGEHTSDQGDEQLHNEELQMQVCERSVDVSAIEQPDKDAKKVNLDLQQKEDEAIEEQTEEIQGNEQKHGDSSTNLTTEILLELQSNEIGKIDLNQDTDEFEAEQTETVAAEMLMNEQTLHVTQGSTPSTADVKAEKSTEIEETPEQVKAPNNIGTLYTDADAENYNEDEKENVEIDAAVAKPSTDEQDGPADETINEEIGNGLASPVENDLQKTSDPAPSNEETLEKDTIVVPENVESRVHGEERECINKDNNDMQASQASEEEIVDEVAKKQERQNEDTDVNNDEVQTKPVDEQASELHSNDSTDNKMDDTMSPYAEMVHGRIDAQPTEIEEVEDNKGFSSISEYAVENVEQNDIEQDLIIHPKVVDDKLATAEQNGTEAETNPNEEMATSYTAVTEAVKFDEVIDDKASGADGALSGENLETFEENRRNLEASSVVTASGESMNEDKEHHNLALPAYSAVDGNTTEQASGSEVTERGLLFPEKPLPTESEEHEESQTTKEKDEDIHGQQTGDMEKEDKEDEQSDLPVSNFLMNLIMGKESTEPDGNLEFEAGKKQEETTKDEERLVPVPTENKEGNKLIFEQGKHTLEGSEEIHDFKLESDEVLIRNTHNLETPVCENNVQGEISSELVPDGPGLMTEVEARDIKQGEKATNSEEGSLKSNLDNSANPKVSQEDTLEEGRTDLKHESLHEDISSDAVAGQTLLSIEPDSSDENKLPNDNDDLQSPLSTKGEESTESSITEAKNAIEMELENEVQKEEEEQHTTNTGGATEGKIENLHGNSQKGTEAISNEQMAEITEPVMGTEINLVHEKDISIGSECDGQTESSEVSNSELHSSEKALDIQSAGSSLHINQDKQDEFAGDQIVMENNLLDKPGESNLHEEQETEIGQESPKESDGGDQNCLAITKPVIKEENANRAVEAHVQTVNTKSSEEQEIFMSQVKERGLDVVSAKEAPEAEENIVEIAKPKFSTDEEQSSKEDKSNMAGENTYVEKTKDQEEAKSFTDEVTTKIEEQEAVQKVSHNQTRDLNVVLPTEAPGSEESFVDIKTPEFSTDEEQSPKEDESNTAKEKSYDEKTNSDEEAKKFTDEAPMKIEERGAGQKASPKKHNILSGVGSKVKHQLAKVKKAIIGKPGHTKSELPKS